MQNIEQTLIERLRTRAEIRRQISSRKSVQEGKPDRISDLLEEAADALEKCKPICHECHEWYDGIVSNREWHKSLKKGRKIIDDMVKNNL